MSSSTDTSFEDEEAFNLYETKQKNRCNDVFRLLELKMKKREQKLQGEKQELEARLKVKKIELRNEEKQLNFEREQLALERKIAEEDLDIKLKRKREKFMKKLK